MVLDTCRLAIPRPTPCGRNRPHGAAGRASGSRSLRSPRSVAPPGGTTSRHRQPQEPVCEDPLKALWPCMLAPFTSMRLESELRSVCKTDKRVAELFRQLTGQRDLPVDIPPHLVFDAFMLEVSELMEQGFIDVMRLRNIFGG